MRITNFQLTQEQVNPVTEFRDFKRNTRTYAELRLKSNGEPHPAEHFIITERLDKWWQRVMQAGEAALSVLLAEAMPPGQET